MNLNDIHRGIVKHRPRKRVGRGKGTGLGKTSGRGHKAQGARGRLVAPVGLRGRPGYLVRRVPKRGFHNKFAPTVAIVNLGALKEFQAGAEVNPGKPPAPCGSCTARSTCSRCSATENSPKHSRSSAHRFGDSAAEKIRKAGGDVIVLPGKRPVPKNKQKQKTK